MQQAAMVVAGRERGRRHRGPLTRWQLRLLDLPVELLLEILTFTMPENRDERWFWMIRVGGTSRMFRFLARNPLIRPFRFVSRTAFLLDDQDPAEHPYRIPPQLRAPFLRSFINAPWNGARLHTFVVTVSDLITAWAVRTLLTTPGILPTLLHLTIDSRLAGFVNVELLHGLARSLPRLISLILSEHLRGGNVTVEEFGIFGALLQQPALQHLRLCFFTWMTDAHIGAFLPYHGRSLDDFAVENCCSILPGDREVFLEDVTTVPGNRIVKLGDATLAAMQANFCQTRLSSLSLEYTEVTRGALTSFLAGVEELNILNVTRTLRLGPEVMDDIIRYLTRLFVFKADFNDWLTDEAIVGLVQAQLDRFGSSQVQELSVVNTQVTPTGLRSVLEMAGGTLSTISVGRSRAQLMDRALDVSTNPELQGTPEEWKALAQDFPNVVFS